MTTDSPNIKVEIISGKDLSQENLDLINKYRKIRLDRISIWDHQSNNYFHERLFFLVKNNNKLVSFGTLRSIKIYIDKQEIEIMGIQAVISIIQGKGYGKILMHEMIKYAEENKLILVGFCEHRNAEFYIKSRLEVFENKNLNFVFVKENGEEYTEEGDVIYYSANGSNIKEALLKNEKIKHFIPHW